MSVTLLLMIQSFKHAGLRRFFEEGKKRGIPTQMGPRLQRRLAVLDDAVSLADIGFMRGFRLHPLKGKRAGEWAISVSGNWRLTFRFDGEHVTDVDLEDYH